jgi:hypothetical protein
MLVSLIETPAHAHPAPAVAPTFTETECITSVSADEHETLTISYSIPFDDVEYTKGDIELPDAKTHQLFAFAGQIVDMNGNLQLVPWDDVDATPQPLPHWITRDDVERAAAASRNDPSTAFDASTVSDVLDEMPALSARSLRITSDQARAPITVEQTKLGFTWNVSDVSPGVYSLAAYTFSPPWNGWTLRPGLVKVVDANHDPPALVLRSVMGLLRGTEGRAITGCVDAAPATQLSLRYRILERPELGWIAWKEAEAALDPLQPTFDSCFVRASSEVVGSVRFRIDARIDGDSPVAALSPDTLTALAGDAICTDEAPGACCPPPMPKPVSETAKRPPSCAVARASATPALASPAWAFWVFAIYSASRLARTKRRSLTKLERKHTA